MRLHHCGEVGKEELSKKLEDPTLLMAASRLAIACLIGRFRALGCPRFASLDWVRKMSASDSVGT